MTRIHLIKVIEVVGAIVTAQMATLIGSVVTTQITG
ncbi:unnamed protein product, partial [marine sediment metagenome]